jgi:hypothetical protein
MLHDELVFYLDALAPGQMAGAYNRPLLSST